MDSLKLNNPGGLLAYQDVLSALQQNQAAPITQLLKAVGDNVIIAGCEIAGNYIAPGIIILNGEILPFEGGANLGFVKAKEVSESRAYKDGVMRPLYYKRTAIPADAGVPIADLFRIETIKELTKKIGKKSDRYDLDDSNTFATSKAVYDSARRYVIKQGWSKMVGSGHDDYNNNYTTSEGEFGNLDGTNEGVRLKVPLNLTHTDYSVSCIFEIVQPNSSQVTTGIISSFSYMEKTAQGFKITVPLVHQYWAAGVKTNVFWSVLNYKIF